MNLSEDQLRFLLPLAVSVIAVFISALSALYSKQLYEIEKAKYKFDKDKAEREFQEELARQKPFVIINAVKQYHNLSLASDKNFAIDKSVIRRGEFSGKKRVLVVHFFPPSITFGIHNKSTEDGLIVDLTDRSFFAEMILANRSDISLWIKGIGFCVRFKSEFPPFPSKYLGESFVGYLDWAYNYDGSKKGIWIEAAQAGLLQSLYRRQWHSSSNIQENVKVRIIDTATSEEISLLKPIELIPNSTKRLMMQFEVTSDAERFLEEHKYESYSLRSQVFWGDEILIKEEEIRQHFFQLRGKAYNLNNFEVIWK